MQTKYNLVENIINLQEKISRTFLNTKFESEKTEAKFLRHIKKIKLENYISYTGLLLFLIGHLINLLVILFKTAYTTLSIVVTTIALISDIMLSLFLRNSKLRKFEKIFNYLKAFLFIIISCFLIITINKNGEDIETIKMSKYFIMLIINYIGYIIYWDDSIIYALLLAFFHEILLTYLFLSVENSKISFSEIIISGFFSVFSYLFKRNKEFGFRTMFIQKYKFKKFFQYCDNLMSHFNCLHMCYVNQKLIFINQNFSNYINPRFIFNKKRMDGNLNSYNTNNNKFQSSITNKNFLANNESNMIFLQNKNNYNNFLKNKKATYIDKNSSSISQAKSSVKNNGNKTFKSISSGSNIEYEELNEFSDDFLYYLEKSFIISEYCEIFKNCYNLKEIIELINKFPFDIKEKKFSNKFTKIGHFKFLNNFANPLININTKNLNKNFNKGSESYIQEENNEEVINEHNQKGNHNEFVYFEVYIRTCGNNIIDILFYDITEIKAAQTSLFKNDLKQKILAKIAHEFKTPINSIIGLINEIKNIQLVQEKEEELKQKKNKDNNEIITSKINIVEIIKNNLNVILNLSNYTIFLINDVIQYASQTDINEIRINVDFMDLKEVLNFCFNILKALVKCNENKANSIKPLLEIEEEIQSIKLMSDEIRLKQIILNFLSNAVKFTKFGNIKLLAKLTEKKDFCEISVIDSGIGIKSEDLNKLFSRENIILDNVENLNKFGSGLGLSICKNLSMRLNHKIYFDSVLGKGSSFTIAIPCMVNNLLKIRNETVNAYSIKKINISSSPIYHNKIELKSSIKTLNSRQKTKKIKNNNNDLNKKNGRPHSKTSISKNKRNCINDEETKGDQIFYNFNKSSKKFSSSIHSSKFKLSINSSIISKKSLRDSIIKLNNTLSPSRKDVYLNPNLSRMNSSNMNLDLKKNISSKFYKRQTIDSNITDQTEEKSMNYIDLNETSKNIMDSFMDYDSHSIKINFNNDNIKINFPKVINVQEGLTKDNKINNLNHEIHNHYVNESFNSNLNINGNNDPNNSGNGNYNIPNVNIVDSNNEITGYFNISGIYKNNKNDTEIGLNNNFGSLNSNNNNQNIYSNNIYNSSKNSDQLWNSNLDNSNNINLVSFHNKSNNLQSSKRNSNGKGNTNLINYSNKTSRRVMSLQEAHNYENIKNIFLNNISQCKSNSSKSSEKECNNNSGFLKDKKKILITDDNFFIRSSLKNILLELNKEKKLNFEILEGNDGIDILKEIIEHHRTESAIDIVLTDEKMEYLNGSETIKILRMLERENKVKKTIIVSLTSFEDEQSKNLILKAGADYLISKPSTKNQIYNVLVKFGIVESSYVNFDDLKNQ